MYTYDHVKSQIAGAKNITPEQRAFLVYECDKCKGKEPELCQRLFTSILNAIGSYEKTNELNNPIKIFNNSIMGLFTDIGHAGVYLEKLIPYVIIAIILIAGAYTLKNVKDLIK